MAGRLASASAQLIKDVFVEKYYDVLHNSPELVYRFYRDTSLLSRPDLCGEIKTVETLKCINELLCSLDLKNCRSEIKTVCAVFSTRDGDGVVVEVTGMWTGSDNQSRNFKQSFCLALDNGLYYVLKDIFRYEVIDEADTNGNAQ